MCHRQDITRPSIAPSSPSAAAVSSVLAPWCNRGSRGATGAIWMFVFFFFSEPVYFSGSQTFWRDHIVHQIPGWFFDLLMGYWRISKRFGVEHGRGRSDDQKSFSVPGRHAVVQFAFDLLKSIVPTIDSFLTNLSSFIYWYFFLNDELLLFLIHDWFLLCVSAWQKSGVELSRWCSRVWLVSWFPSTRTTTGSLR